MDIVYFQATCFMNIPGRFKSSGETELKPCDSVWLTASSDYSPLI